MNCGGWGEVVALHTKKAYMGSRATHPLIFNLGASWRWVINITPRTLYLWEWTRYPLNRRGWVGPRARVAVVFLKELWAVIGCCNAWIIMTFAVCTQTLVLYNRPTLCTDYHSFIYYSGSYMFRHSYVIFRERPESFWVTWKAEMVICNITIPPATSLYSPLTSYTVQWTLDLPTQFVREGWS
jgi:hypothetical protein